jgi:hypothetical protein
MKIDEIKKNYPNEWLLLGDVVESEDGQQILAADLLYHSPTKRALALMDKPLLKGYVNKTKAVIFNRTCPPRKISILAGGRTIGAVKPICLHIREYLD